MLKVFHMRIWTFYVSVILQSYKTIEKQIFSDFLVNHYVVHTCIIYHIKNVFVLHFNCLFRNITFLIIIMFIIINKVLTESLGVSRIFKKKETLKTELMFLKSQMFFVKQTTACSCTKITSCCFIHNIEKKR